MADTTEAPLLRPLKADEQAGTYKIANGIVTADSDAHRRRYNCHGFALGFPSVVSVGNDPHGLLQRLGYVPREAADLRDDDEVIALFFDENATGIKCPWHMAKRLRTTLRPLLLYESKCGYEVDPNEFDDPEDRAAAEAKAAVVPPEGLRVVHTIESIKPVYGVVESLWVRDQSEAGEAKRRAFMEAEYSREPDPDEWALVEDSAALFNDILQLAQLILRAHRGG